jgi:hypothetical protein
MSYIWWNNYPLVYNRLQVWLKLKVGNSSDEPEKVSYYEVSCTCCCLVHSITAATSSHVIDAFFRTGTRGVQQGEVPPAFPRCSGGLGARVSAGKEGISRATAGLAGSQVRTHCLTCLTPAVGCAVAQ